MNRRQVCAFSLAAVLVLLSPIASLGGAWQGGPAASSPIYLPAVLKGYAGCVTVSTLIAPADGGTLSTLIPLFQWNDGNDPNTTYVRLQVAKDVAFQDQQGVLQTSSRGAQQFRFEWNFDPATTYYWRAHVYCHDTLGPYSETWSFTTPSSGTVLPAPTLIAPANGSTLPGETTTLEWAPVSGASGYLQHYRRAGTLGYSYNWRTETTFPAGRLTPGTTYEWWISAWNDYAIGTDSEKWLFTTPAGSLSGPVQGCGRWYVMDDDGVVAVCGEAGGP
jgi:hypothetical protein